MDETENEARKEKLAEEAEDRINRQDAHWTDWMYVGDGLAVGQAKAMRKAGTNRPYGRAFTQAMGEWLTAHPWAKRIDPSARSALLWVIEHRSEVDDWRTNTLDSKERNRLNHPTSLKRKFDAWKRAQDAVAKDPNAAKKETKIDALVRENEELWAENTKLKRRVDSGDGSLFDLKRDSVESIADTIGRNVTIGRLEAIQRAVTKKLADLKAAEKAKTAKAG
jgi:hypothetical protein